MKWGIVLVGVILVALLASCTRSEPVGVVCLNDGVDYVDVRGKHSYRVPPTDVR
jgi:hypothetical protein